MNPFISQLMEFIPERTPRTLYGAQFESADKTSCRHPERFAFIAAQLDWLTPLRVLTREEQVFLGLRNANGRPQQDAELDDEALAAEEGIEEVDALDAAEEGIGVAESLEAEEGIGDEEALAEADPLEEIAERPARPAAENPLMMPG